MISYSSANNANIRYNLRDIGVRRDLQGHSIGSDVRIHDLEPSCSRRDLFLVYVPHWEWDDLM